jgi:hypothetical protein
MSGRDHACECCGRGGMNDLSDAEISRLKAEVERLTSLRTSDAKMFALACMEIASESTLDDAVKRIAARVATLIHERDQARADLAAARWVVGAVLTVLTAYGVHDPAEKVKRAVVILRGEGPK